MLSKVSLIGDMVWFAAYCAFVIFMLLFSFFFACIFGVNKRELWLPSDEA
jgi:hypothetical protein